jgi:ribosomal protein S18 acetylase RimI-like enzyme
MELMIRKIGEADVPAIARLDAIHSGEAKPVYWQERLSPFIRNNGRRLQLGYVAETGGRACGYILAEARAWEFGSPLCGWILAIGVDPEVSRQGVGLSLCRAVSRRFKELDIRTVRTMVRKDDVPLLSFFRASGFRAGPFIEMELGL